MLHAKYVTLLPVRISSELSSMFFLGKCRHDRMLMPGNARWWLPDIVNRRGPNSFAVIESARTRVCLLKRSVIPLQVVGKASVDPWRLNFISYSEEQD